jgi:hypothetical protein
VSPSAIALLLRLLEAPELSYGHDKVVRYHGADGQVLIDAGLLTATGHFVSVVMADEGDTAMVEVKKDQERGEFGYHSPLRGWTRVEKSRLQIYTPDLALIFRSLLGRELPLGDRGPIDLEGSLLFELGSSRLLPSGPKSDVWFARRLGDQVVADRIRDAIRRRPSARLRLLLTSTPRDRIDALSLPMTRVVPVGDVLSSCGDRIDTDILKARFAGVAPPIDLPLHLSDDNRRLTINGKTMTFRGRIVTSIIRIFVDAHARQERLSAEVVLGQSGSSANSLDQAFGKRWQEIKPHLRARNGTWAFEV